MVGAAASVRRPRVYLPPARESDGGGVFAGATPALSRPVSQS